MWQKRIGYIDGGVCSIDLVAREGTGGEFYSCPEAGSVPRIKVGFDYEDFAEVMSVLAHEIMEFVLTSRGHRYCKAPDFGEDMTGLVFHFDHSVISECTRILGFAFVNAGPAMMDIYRTRRRTVKVESRTGGQKKKVKEEEIK